MGYKKISVVIPHYNDPNINECLKFLLNQDYPKDFYEILIIDNASTEFYLEEELHHSKNCRIMQQYKRGSYASRNIGIHHAEGDIIAFTDSDCVPDVHWLSNINQEFQNSEDDIVAVQGKSFSTENNVVAQAIHEMYNDTFERYVLLQNESCLGLDTRNCAIIKNVFEKIGVFNEDMLFWGDSELGKRINEHGWKIKYSPMMNIIHHDIEELDVFMKKRIKEGKISSKTFLEFGAKYTKKYFPEMLFIFLKSKQDVNSKCIELINLRNELKDDHSFSPEEQKDRIKEISMKAFTLGVISTTNNYPVDINEFL